MRRSKMQTLSNPRGSIWANDKNKLGYQMLEKMGWSEGKGLGKDEQGVVEVLESKKIINQRGLGYKKEKKSLADHYDAFENVLSDLNNFNATNTDDNDTIETSVEEPFLNSKSTFRYKKFAQFKDVKQYNEEDLACVLGTKMPDRRKDIKGNMDNGTYTISRTSLKDYFEDKMEQIRKKREEGILGGGQSSACNISIPDIDSEPAKTEFSFNVSSTEPVDETGLPCNNEDDGAETTRKIKRKKSKKGIRNKELEDGDAGVKGGKKGGVSESDAAPLLLDETKTSNEDEHFPKGKLFGKVKKLVSTVTSTQRQRQGKFEENLINPKTENGMLSGDQNSAPNCIIPDLEYEAAKTEFSFDVSTTEPVDETGFKRKNEDDGEEATRKIKKKKSKKGIRNKELGNGDPGVKEREKNALNKSYAEAVQLDETKAANVEKQLLHKREKLLWKMKKLFSTESLAQGRHCDKLEGSPIFSNVKMNVDSIRGHLETVKNEEENSNQIKDPEGEVIEHKEFEIENVAEQGHDLGESSSSITVLIKKQECIIDVNDLFPGSNLASIKGYDNIQRFL